MTRRGSDLCLLALLAATAAAYAPVAKAQYFGGNKVRYEDPEFRVLKTEHFDIYAYAEEDPAAGQAAVLVERWNARLSQLFEHQLSSRQPLILYTAHPQFRQTNATPGEIGEGTGGFTEMFKRRVVLPFAGPARETDHVLGHELVHAFQYDLIAAARNDPKARAAGRSSARLPLWFVEGIAEYLSLGSVDAQTMLWVRDALAHEDLPPIRKLGRPKYFPYRWGHAFWAYVGGRYGDAAVGRLMRAVLRKGSTESAIKDELKTDEKQLSADWHAALRAEIGPAVAAAHPASDYGRAIVAGRRGRAEINLAPSLSPDGRRLLFFSERGRHSIELYLLDVDSGEVVRRLTTTATDPHVDSLQFLQSAGAWSPDGRRIAIGSVAKGRPMLTILDAGSGDTVEEHRFDDLAEVLHPAWSPDGAQIAFSGNAGGFLQIYALDLASRQRRQLTRDPFTAMQPAWSPDGKRLAFVTDRFTSDARRLTFGEFRLARLDVASGAVTALPAIEGGKHINPQWDADGRHLYFVGDARGAPNLHRLDVGSGTIEQLTDLKTGISGITRLSPTLSVAANRVAAGVFDDGMYHIYLLDRLQARPVPTPPAGNPNALPPRQRHEPKVDGLIAQATPAAGAVDTSAREPYQPRLSPDYASQVSAGVGVSSAGSVVAGGIALHWSDMLGDHNLLTLLQSAGSSDDFLRNTAAIVAYDNRERRWNWGAAAGQIPSVSAGYFVESGTYNGQPATAVSFVREWQINREVSGRLAYPLSRADRTEFSAGWRHISFESSVYQEIYSNNTGQLLAYGEFDLASPPPLDLYPAGVAFVHDNSVFGGTAPVLGARYRVEAGGVGGDLKYYAPLVDLRQYVEPIPYLTLAGRALHYGRYSGDAEDPRLGELSVGGPTLVRGYDVYSFDLAECDPAAAPACPALDQLFGSRIAVASVEARTPLVGPRALLPTVAAPPIDLALFYDTGVAWRSGEKPDFLDGVRDAVRSYGASLRVSLYGAIVLEWNYVRPLDRPADVWQWEFWIAPGF